MSGKVFADCFIRFVTLPDRRMLGSWCPWTYPPTRNKLLYLNLVVSNVQASTAVTALVTGCDPRPPTEEKALIAESSYDKEFIDYPHLARDGLTRTANRNRAHVLNVYYRATFNVRSDFSKRIGVYVQCQEACHTLSPNSDRVLHTHMAHLDE